MDSGYEYGVGVSNRYELFLEENEDPLEVLQKQELKIEADKKAKIKLQKKIESLKLVIVKKDIEKKKTITKNMKSPQNTEQTEVTNSIKVDDVKVAKEVKSDPIVTQPEAGNKEKQISTSNNSLSNVECHENVGTNLEGKGGSGRSSQGRGQERGNFHRPRLFYNQVGHNFSEPGTNNAQSVTLRGRGRGGRGRGYRPGRGVNGYGQGRDFQYKRESYQNYGPAEGEQPATEPEFSHEALEPEEQVADQHPDIMTTQQPDCSVAGAEHQMDWSAEQSEEQATGDLTPADTVTLQQEAAPSSELTLDEWRALQGNRDKPSFNIRKAGEGEDSSQWQPMFALDNKKDSKDQDHGDKEEEEVDLFVLYPQRAGKQKKLQVDICFTDAQRLWRGGGRGQNRGSEHWDAFTFGDYGKEDQRWKGRGGHDSSYNEEFEGRGSYRRGRGRGNWYGIKPFNKAGGGENGPYESSDDYCEREGEANSSRVKNFSIDGHQDTGNGDNVPNRYHGRGNRFENFAVAVDGSQGTQNRRYASVGGNNYLGKGSGFRGVHGDNESPQDLENGENTPVQGKYFRERDNTYRGARGGNNGYPDAENGEGTSVGGNYYYYYRRGHGHRSDSQNYGGQCDGYDFRGSYRGWRGRERSRRHGRYNTVMPDDTGSANHSGMMEQGSQFSQDIQVYSSVADQGNTSETPNWVQSQRGSKQTMQKAFEVDDENDFPPLG